MRNSIKIFLVFFFCFRSALAMKLDETRWFDCVVREECLELSRQFRHKLDRKNRSVEYLYAVYLSALLAEYLRGDGEPLDIGVLEGASETASMGGDEASSLITKAMIRLVIGERNSVRDILANTNWSGSYLISAGFVLALSYDGTEKFNKYSEALLRRNFIPLLAIRSGGKLFEGGKYQKKIYERLKLVIRKFPYNHRALGWMIGFLSRAERGKEADSLIEGIDTTFLKGTEGSIILTEMASHRLKAGRIQEAEGFLKEAISMDPRNSSAMKLLGKIYLVHKKDISRATAILKNYVNMDPSDPDAIRISSAISKLEPL